MFRASLPRQTAIRDALRDLLASDQGGHLARARRRRAEAFSEMPASEAAGRGRGRVMLHTILLVFAFVCFLLGAFPVPSRVNLVALGLAAWVLTLLL